MEWLIVARSAYPSLSERSHSKTGSNSTSRHGWWGNERPFQHHCRGYRTSCGTRSVPGLRKDDVGVCVRNRTHTCA
jgi:hypothetical protein